MPYFVIDPDTGQAVFSENPDFYLVVAKSGFVYQYHYLVWDSDLPPDKQPRV